MTTKKEYRKVYQEKRNNLHARDMHERIAGMMEVFRSIQLQSIQIVFSYKAMSARKEVPVSYFEQQLSSEIGHVHFCYPAADFATQEMTAYLDDDSLIWQEVGFGLEQPAAGTIVNPLEIDCVFVPLLAFDEKGYRLGYGKGFYDRYLKKCRPDSIKIGFSWFEPVILLPEIHEQDVPLNYCVTPHQLYVF